MGEGRRVACDIIFFVIMFLSPLGKSKKFHASNEVVSFEKMAQSLMRYSLCGVSPLIEL